MTTRASKQRNGKSGEYIVFALLNDLGFDVYIPSVDDRGVDGILRIQDGSSEVRYVDFQIKSATFNNPHAGVSVEAISAKCENYICIFLRRNNKSINSFYLTRDQIISIGSRTVANNPKINAAMRDYLYESQSLHILYDRLMSNSPLVDPEENGKLMSLTKSSN